MNLHFQLKTSLANLQPEELVKKLGYSNFKSAIGRVQRTLDDPCLGIGRGEYDFLYNGKEFLQKLMEISGMSPQTIEQQILFIEEKSCKYNAGFCPWIFIDTDFSRTSEPVWMLALLEKTRRLSVGPEINLLSRGEAIDWLINVCKSHYESLATSGVNGHALTVWGEIKRYIIHYQRNLLFEIAPNGKVAGIHTDLGTENHAVLAVKKHQFFYL